LENARGGKLLNHYAHVDDADRLNHDVAINITIPRVTIGIISTLYPCTQIIKALKCRFQHGGIVRAVTPCVSLLIMTTLDHPNCMQSFRIPGSTVFGIPHERRP